VADANLLILLMPIAAILGASLLAGLQIAPAPAGSQMRNAACAQGKNHAPSSATATTSTRGIVKKTAL